MFNKNFFPTPQNVVKIMLGQINLDRANRFLDPSAGKGNILEVLRDELITRYYGDYHVKSSYYHEMFRKSLYAIEIEPELRAILLDKNFQVVDSDWLSHSPERNYDVLLINPPFENSEKHLIHALTQCPEADTICLLNEDSYYNTDTSYWNHLRMVLDSRDYLETSLGPCFQNSERPTQVRVVMLTIKGQDSNKKFNFDFSDMHTQETQYTVKDINSNQLETRDVFKSLVNRYERIKKLASEVKYLEAEMQFFSKGLIKDDFNFLKLLQESDYSNFIDSFRNACWDNVFLETKLANYLTTKVRKEVVESQEKQRSLAFSEHNIYELLLILSGSLPQIKSQCIEEAFDLLTKYYFDNREVLEGWKTNIAWKVRDRFILPHARDYSYSYPVSSDTFRNSISDIEKAFCLVAGLRFDEIKDSSVSKITGISSSKTLGLNFGKWYDSYFFKFKMYKKGTMHFIFKDRNLLARFNYEVCSNRNWLGGSFD